MKPLLPTLKEKKRYIVYTIKSEKPITSASIVKELHKTLGLFESAKAGLQDIKYDKKKQQGILRCELSSVDKVRAALTLVQHIAETKVRITTIGVSGILNKTERFTIKN